MLWLPIAVTAVSSVALLFAYHRESRLGIWIAKPLAAAGFLATALVANATATTYGTILLVGLILAALGDVFLIPKARRYFLFGLVSFLLGHIGYALAFFVRGVDPAAVGITAVVCGVAAVVVGRWLLPHVEGSMRRPVLVYIAVITTMVPLSIGAVVAGGPVTIAIGTIGFYLSDLAVARERFVAKSFVNKLWGSPLYFAAQLVLATSVL